MNEKINANEVIAELQNEIADKALQIALLKAQRKDAKKPVEASAADDIEKGDEQ